MKEKDPKSMLNNHCKIDHQGRRVSYKMDVIKTFHPDTTLCQTRGVEIEKTPTDRLMKTRNEWNPSLIPKCTIQR